ncbi:MAG TPA: F0F1 ATP synthase subunit A [Actinomycetota bacterium]|nr:F0F1 ATP synthase subunit A [Actinomycetota bacterium]
MTLLAASRPPQPFDAPGLELFRPPCLAEWDALGINFCVDRGILYMFLAAAIVILLFVLAARHGGLVPRGVRNLVESVVGFIRDEIAVQVIGPEGRPWVPFLTAMFMFILVGNIFGIIPGIQFPVNGRIAIPAFMALLVWVLFNVAGIRAQGLGYFKSALFPPGVPKAMYLLLTPIEFVSTFLLRPFTLAVRLLANMMAGHLILSIFFLGTAYLLAKPTTIPFAVPAFALSVALTGFEILVAVLQAYIFTILTAVYIAGAVHPEH